MSRNMDEYVCVCTITDDGGTTVPMYAHVKICMLLQATLGDCKPMWDFLVQHLESMVNAGIVRRCVKLPDVVLPPHTWVVIGAEPDDVSDGVTVYVDWADVVKEGLMEWVCEEVDHINTHEVCDE